MTHIRLAVMPGDGVGPELIEHGLTVLNYLADHTDLSYEPVWFPHSAKHYLATGETLGEDAAARLAECDSLLFGAAGDPSVPPGLLERELILGLSRQFDLWLGVRPMTLHHENLTPLKGLKGGDVDLVVLRDVVEGAAAIPGGRLNRGTAHEVAVNTVMHSRHGVDRVLRAAFELADRRRGNVRVVAQSNVLVSHLIWEERMNAVAAEYPGIEFHLMHPDHAANMLVRDPGAIDVLVTDLLLGGLFSDLAGGLLGGAGLVGSARRNPDTGFGLYEPAHGSAPKYAGKDRVSPFATLNALVMLLEDCGARESAEALNSAISVVLSSGEIDLSTRSTLGTSSLVSLVIEALER